LPKGAEWFDFWTGKQFVGGKKVEADASYETMPVFIRAGSIIPLGPFIQYSTERNDPIEIRIYPGANGEFTLYEDENDNYGYLSGLYSLTTFRWNDEQKMLTINARKGSYPGMPKAHTFNVVLAGENKGVGVEVSTMIDKAIRYSGKEVIIRF
jgi:alpha-D-xyloside xylohydrolase